MTYVRGVCSKCSGNLQIYNKEFNLCGSCYGNKKLNIKKICPSCLKEFFKHGNSRKYCSVDCAVKHNITINENGCHLWKGTLSHCGYAMIKIKSKRFTLHKYLYEQFHNTKGIISHRCNNRNCININHLYSKSENYLIKNKSARHVMSIKIDRFVIEKIIEMKEFGLNSLEISDIFNTRYYSNFVNIDIESLKKRLDSQKIIKISPLENKILEQAKTELQKKFVNQRYEIK